MTRREAFAVLFEGTGWLNDEQLDREFQKFEAAERLRNFPSTTSPVGFVNQDALGLSRRDGETVQEALARAGLVELGDVACALADAWQAIKNDDPGGFPYIETPLGEQDERLITPLATALDDLERRTRPRAERKVLP